LTQPEAYTTTDPQKHTEEKGQGDTFTQGIEHIILAQKSFDNEPIIVPTDGTEPPRKSNEDVGKNQQEKHIELEQAIEHIEEQEKRDNNVEEGSPQKINPPLKNPPLESP